MNDIFRGSLVRLTVEEPAVLASAFARWNRDTEYTRLLDIDPLRMWSQKKWKDLIEKDVEKDPPDEYFFQVRTLSDECLIGFVGLFPIWVHQNAWVGIGLGERDYWGKGYGTDALRLVLHFAFMELNLNRVSLDVFEYNLRAIHSYEKAGFCHEGRQRQLINRNGKRWDMLEMGILREEWLVANPS